MTRTLSVPGPCEQAQTTSFPGGFVHGQDTLSQRQLIDYCSRLGWSLTNADGGAKKASQNDHVVLLPPSGPRYTIEESAQLMAALQPQLSARPGRGRPDSAEFDLLMQMYRNIGIPLVGVGHRWEPTVPQIERPEDAAPALIELDRDMEAVAKQRWPWAQPWHPRTVTGENRDEVLTKEARWRPDTKRGHPATKWRPCAHPAICMWASSARHLSCQNDDQIGELIEAKDPRTIRKAIERGDQAWASLGAWPWKAFESGVPSDEWWALDAPWDRLIDEVNSRLRRGERFLAAVRAVG
jgi:hypothetical protein